eukprot:gene36606-45151_t
MDSLLKHMVDMTGHRDHTMLDVSVISAVQELAGARQTRVLTLTSVRGQIFVRPRAIIVSGSAARMEEHADPSCAGDPISQFPALADCIARHEASADQVDANGNHTLWLPIWLGDKANTCLEIVNPTPYTSETIHIVGGIDNAHRIIDRFRANVESHEFPQVGKVTVSIGYVSISAYQAPVIILGQADQALYYAKSHGRNKVCHYDELVSGGLLQVIESNDEAEFF